ncbi:MAG: hypothetical protein AABX30_01780 [Nanoarchaeota archaeon]
MGLLKKAGFGLATIVSLAALGSCAHNRANLEASITRDLSNTMLFGTSKTPTSRINFNVSGNQKYHPLFIEEYENGCLYETMEGERISGTYLPIDATYEMIIRNEKGIMKFRINPREEKSHIVYEYQ